MAVPEVWLLGWALLLPWLSPCTGNVLTDSLVRGERVPVSYRQGTAGRVRCEATLCDGVASRGRYATLCYGGASCGRYAALCYGVASRGRYATLCYGGVSCGRYATLCYGGARCGRYATLCYGGATAGCPATKHDARFCVSLRLEQ